MTSAAPPALSSPAAAGPTTAAPPVLRVVPAPPCAPPYDDEPAAGPALRLVAALPTAAEPAVLDDPWPADGRTPTAQLPAARAFAGTLVLGVLEVLAGVRSVTQLRRETTPDLYAALTQTLGPLGRPRGPRPDRRSVRSLHVQERPDGVVEVCATVRRGSRFGALALRLEGQDGRWRCTDLIGL
ncbi:MAG: Rv3235 family protein [Mycobacteriales bacterium]